MIYYFSEIFFKIKMSYNPQMSENLKGKKTLKNMMLQIDNAVMHVKMVAANGETAIAFHS